MDPNAAPWRSLDAEAPAAEEAPSSRGGIPLPAVAAGAGAVVLAVAAFLLAMSSGGGSLVIAGGEPLPSASGDVALPPPGGRSELVVEVVGAVTRPGVYRLRAGTRIGDLVDAAGGYSPRVDVDRASRDLNHAALLADGDQVRVPSRDDGAGPAVRPVRPAPATERSPAGRAASWT